jgi:hypothetical protein
VRGRRTVSDKPFFLPDRYASVALGTFRPVGGAFVDLEIHVAGRGLSHTIIPELDEEVLTVVGEVEEEAAAVRSVLGDRSSRRELWNEPTLPMELQSYVRQLLERGELFIHLHFAKSKSGDFSLFKTRWIAPETIVVRAGRPRPYEQFVSWRAYHAPDYHIAATPVDHFTEFAVEEMLYLRWPLPEPAGATAPAAVALQMEKLISKAANDDLLRARAAAEPDETYISLARARAGAYADALETQKTLSSRARHMLFYPGTDEAEAFPWAERITDFFRADRILRSRIAIAELRDYLFSEFNRQVLGAWSRLNDWSEIRLELRPQLFTVAEWEAMRKQLHGGSIGLEDVQAAARAEAETARAFVTR